MKKVKNAYSGFSVFGFFLFFFTITLITSISVIVFNYVNTKFNGNLLYNCLAMLGTITIGATFCTLMDIFRRKNMVEAPVEKILYATQKIASGDFNVKLSPMHEYNKYDGYDIIFENLNTLASELSKNEILKNDFISNVSHEIKTPLSVIQNYAKLLQ